MTGKHPSVGFSIRWDPWCHDDALAVIQDHFGHGYGRSWLARARTRQVEQAQAQAVRAGRCRLAAPGHAGGRSALRFELFGKTFDIAEEAKTTDSPMVIETECDRPKCGKTSRHLAESSRTYPLMMVRRSSARRCLGMQDAARSLSIQQVVTLLNARKTPRRNASCGTKI